MTDTGWPGEPGVPLNPEQDGWHWRSWDTDTLIPVWWSASRGWDDAMCLEDAYDCIYAGPCHTPAALAAAKEEGRREGAEAMRATAAKVCEGWLEVWQARNPQHVTAQDWANGAVEDCVDRIRALPAPPQPQEPPHE